MPVHQAQAADDPHLALLRRTEQGLHRGRVRSGKVSAVVTPWAARPEKFASAALSRATRSVVLQEKV